MSRIVKQAFFCAKSKKSYKVGDTYDGDRDDLDHVLEPKPKPTKKKSSNKK